jgi:3-hydroxyisobutyrate dehydrogenase
VPGLVPQAPSTHDYRGGFATKLMLKDMKLAQSAAATYGVPLSLGSVATSLYEHCVSAGLGDYDNSIVFKFITKDDVNHLEG